MSDISSADLDYIESVFEQIDINNDGTITLSELASSKKLPSNYIDIESSRNC